MCLNVTPNICLINSFSNLSLIFLGCIEFQSNVPTHNKLKRSFLTHLSMVNKNILQFMKQQQQFMIQQSEMCMQIMQQISQPWKGAVQNETSSERINLWSLTNSNTKFNFDAENDKMCLKASSVLLYLLPIIPLATVSTAPCRHCSFHRLCYCKCHRHRRLLSGIATVKVIDTVSLASKSPVYSKTFLWTLRLS